MKKIFLSLITVIILSFFFVTSQTGCTKETVTSRTDTVFQCPQNIQGLWVGTYIVGPGNPVPAGTAFFFSFSIHPDGTMSYKSKGYYNGSSDYITFADGTWLMTGTTFSFSVTTVNIAGGGAQHTQSGTATYNSTNGTLSNGVISDPAGGSATWSMNRVN